MPKSPVTLVRNTHLTAANGEPDNWRAYQAMMLTNLKAEGDLRLDKKGNPLVNLGQTLTVGDTSGLSGQDLRALNRAGGAFTAANTAQTQDYNNEQERIAALAQQQAQAQAGAASGPLPASWNMRDASAASMAAQAAGPVRTATPTGEMRALGDLEAFTIFNPVGRFGKGLYEGAAAIVRSPLTLAEGVGNLAMDAYGYGKDALLGADRGVFGDERPYQAQSGLVRSIQTEGVLGTAGNATTAIVKSLPGIAQIDALNRRDWGALGSSIPGTALAVTGAGWLSKTDDLAAASTSARALAVGEGGVVNSEIGALSAAERSASFQGVAPYEGVDILRNIRLSEGKRVAHVTFREDGRPISEYFTSESAIKRATLPDGIRGCESVEPRVANICG